jgi:ABC-type lipoprotein release transport system permease subunit
MTTLRMAWRNLWRNGRRTLITGSAIGLGLAAMIFWLGLQNGMNHYLQSSVTSSYLGDAQIHADGYRETRETEDVIPHAAAVLARADSLPAVRAASPRLLANGLVAIGDRAAPVELVGIDPARERRVTDWSERLLAGAYPDGPRDALLGRDLADKLEVEPGSRLVLTLADEKTGELNSVLLTVAGVVYTGNPFLDKGTLILNRHTLGTALGLPDAMHEIALRLTVDTDQATAMDAALAPLRAPGLDVAHWLELSPSLAGLRELQDFYYAITLLIVFAIIALGIVNTLAMSLAERHWEFGVMRAIGTSPGRLAGLIFAEAASLGVLGAALGLLLGAVTHAVISQHGLWLGGFQVAGVDFESRVYTELSLPPVLLVASIFVALSTLTGLGTAVRAARIQPATALREL